MYIGNLEIPSKTEIILAINVKQSRNTLLLREEAGEAYEEMN
jgi:hypothetical protein